MGIYIKSRTEQHAYIEEERMKIEITRLTVPPAIQVQGNSSPRESNGTITLSNRPIPGSLEGPSLRPSQGSQFRATFVFPKLGTSSYSRMLSA